ncbi:proton-coupled folate transporter-like [Lingula anatina]|uniref:Proton-coupled folate transporter-like n=1 Tax=Lingula anatina TaxID=7574 RepID=A0A1S3KFU3_LINAN|nr:proton-coupled folate transporter-like [Lingula anatina]|eukprot:XP_013421329.1 proton-coupled folate transporter-like [Lingula anatina]
MLGLLVILPVFKRFLALEDTSLVIIGQVSSVLGQVLLAFSNTVWMVMLVPFAGMLSGLSSAALRSIVAKMVGPDEQGKAFAFLGCAQALSILMASLIFNNLYPATLHFLPGLSYLVCALLTVAVMALTIVMRCYMPVEETTNTQDDQTLDNTGDGHRRNGAIHGVVCHREMADGQVGGRQTGRLEERQTDKKTLL